ncbi:UvrD-helicase domain-containing protein [Deferrisoma palaeochoriense]
MRRERAEDREARRRIREDLDVNFLVEASAGSGKTTSLVDRIVALVAGGRAQMGEIAAVTFTRKAAAEIRERVQNELERRLRSAPAAERARLEGALAALGGAALGTVHSFCARMLRLFPVEAGVDPSFEELEEEAAEAVLDEVWEEHLDRERGTPLFRELVARGMNPRDLRGLFGLLAEYRDVEPVTGDASDAPDLSGVARELEGFLAEVEPHVPPAPQSPDGLQTAVLTARRLRAERGFAHAPTLVEALEAFASAGVTLNRWPDRALAYRFRDELLPAFQERAVRPALALWRTRLHPLCVAFARPALALAEARRRARGTLDYGDLLLLARRLLRDHPDVRRELARRFRRILVDEFQDTDPVQAEILFYLAGDDPAGGGPWHARPLRPGALFLVGDPKQSIYRFRRGDIETYQRVKGLVVAQGGEVLRLRRNFRSVPAVCAYVNRAFSTLFPAEDTPYQAAHAPLWTTRRPPAEPLSGVWRLTLPSAGTKDEMLAHEARLVASWVRWALEGNLRVRGKGGRLRRARPGDVLVLTRKTESLPGLAAALEAQGVPVDLTGAEAPGDDPLVAGVANLLAALAAPDDGAALVAALTGPLFGHSWQDLLDHRHSGGALGISSPPGAGHPEVRETLGFLRELRAEALARPPVAAVEWVIERTGVAALAAAGPRGGTAAGRFETLIDLAREAEAVGRSDFASAAAHIAETVSAARPPRNVLAGQAGGVRLMNLHKAKGLEAPVVVLAGAWNRGRHPVRYRVDRDAGGGAVGYFPAWKPAGDWHQKILAHPPGWDAQEAVETQYRDAEERRLLYVAATRAGQVLVISRPQGKAASGSAWKELLEFVDDELPPAGLDLPPPARRRVDPDPRGERRAVARALGGLQRAATPTWTRRPVTSLVDTPPPARAGPGRGAAWGTAVHRALERLGAGRPLPDPVLRRILEEEGLDPERAGELRALVDAVRGSPLWERAARSPERLAEAPFAVNLAGSGEAPDLVEGVVDLAFREDGGWVLVDYKTDEVGEDPAPWVAHYGPQLRAYARAWERLTGEPVRETRLLFVHGLREVPVPLANGR